LSIRIRVLHSGESNAVTFNQAT